MKALHSSLLSQKLVFMMVSVILIIPTTIFAQVSPYSLSPDWAFGVGGRLTFPNGNFPTSGAPAAGSRTTNTVPSPEASTSICFRNGNVAMYTNTTFAYNGASAAGWTDYIRNFNNTGDNTCAGSSTGGAVAFPDPASPDNAFYLVLANDQTGGNCQFQGVNRYRFTGTGTTVAYNAGPTLMAPGNWAGEAITAGTDGTGGYWVVIHDRDASNTFRVWHFTAGGISAPTDYTPSANVTSTINTQSYLKISPCQDKIAYHSGGILVVHEFNRTTGAVGAELRRINTTEGGVGLEFSPDGSRVYYCGAGPFFTGGEVRYVNIASGTTGIVTGSASWSLQTGPDGRIYTSPTSNNVGVINTPNGVPSYSTIALPGGASVFRGLANMAWLSPQLPVVTAAPTATCNIFNFSFNFPNYFNASVGVNVPSIVWNWGDGSPNTTGVTNPSHTFPTTGGPYTVTLTFQDATCGHTWTDQESVVIDCAAPVELIHFSGIPRQGAALLNWQTATEINNHFFELQRSTDGQDFETIARINGAGNSTQTLSYHYTDLHVPADLVYYRLIQHDFDGTTAMSKTIAVRFNVSGSGKPSIVPNPFSDAFTLSKSEAEAAIVSVYDVLGKLLEQKTSPETELNVTLGDSLANGSYIVHYTSGNNSYSLHVEKK